MARAPVVATAAADRGYLKARAADMEPRGRERWQDAWQAWQPAKWHVWRHHHHHGLDRRSRGILPAPMP